MSKETYYNVKRDLLQCQKRPVTGSKSFVLYDCLKRPITMSKETYYNVKRDLLQCQKRPITWACRYILWTRKSTTCCSLIKKRAPRLPPPVSSLRAGAANYILTHIHKFIYHISIHKYIYQLHLYIYIYNIYYIYIHIICIYIYI
jgi:hypothetical protein